MVEIFNLIFNAIAALAAIVASIIALKTLTESKKEQKDGLNRQKKQATLDAYNQLQIQVFDQINLYKPSEIKAIAEDNRCEQYKILSNYLARIEHFCVGLETDIYDYRTFYELANGYFDSDKGMLKPRITPLIQAKQKGADKDYYSNIHKVWEKMSNMEEYGKRP